MSLNRRLYQWLLNRSGDAGAISSLPVGDESLDTSFFVETTLPLIHDALEEYLELDTVEVATTATSLLPGLSGALDPSKDASQLQFAEVRVCRQLLYLLDRPEIGRPVLLSLLPRFLEVAARHDPSRVEQEEVGDEVFVYERSGFGVCIKEGELGEQTVS